METDITEIDITPNKEWFKAALKIIARDSTKKEDRKWAIEELRKSHPDA